MKLAIISPVSMLEECSTHYHLVLTQYYSTIPKYRDFYLRRRALGDFIILDNGAAEIKHSIDDKYLVEVARELRPNVLVAPDVIHDYNKTIERTRSFIGAYSVSMRELGISIMGVPQGETKEEWWDCYSLFNDTIGIQWLGISMFYDKMFDGRDKLLKSIEQTVTKPCHLLGIHKNPLKVADEKKFSFVRSVDSAKPVEFGLEGLTLDSWHLHKHIDDDMYFKFKPNRDYPAWEHFDKLIHKNIAQMKEVVECSSGLC